MVDSRLLIGEYVLLVHRIMCVCFLYGIVESSHYDKGGHHSDHNQTQSREDALMVFCVLELSSACKLSCVLVTSLPDVQVSLRGRERCLRVWTS